jgi:hypothetical protein
LAHLWQVGRILPCGDQENRQGKKGLTMRTGIIEKVDRLCEVLVYAISFDRETIADLSDWFGKLSRLALQTDQLEMAAVSKAAALVLEKTIAAESTDKSPKILPQKPRWFRPYEVSRAKADNKGIIKLLLINELENMGHFYTGDMLCQGTLLNPAVKNMWRELLV